VEKPMTAKFALIVNGPNTEEQLDNLLLCIIREIEKRGLTVVGGWTPVEDPDVQKIPVSL
jgi:hydrogenase maturation factor